MSFYQVTCVWYLKYMSRFSRVGLQSSPKNLLLCRAMVTCTSYKADGHTRLYCKVKSYTPRFVEFVPCLATYGIADLSRSSLICIRSTRYKIVLDISPSSRQVYFILRVYLMREYDTEIESEVCLQREPLYIVF